MRNDLNWDDLGRRIEDAVNWAVNSRNYEHLNQTIRQTVESAVDLGSEAVRKAAKTVQYQPPKTTVVRAPSVSHLYGKTGGKVVGGILMSVFGGLFTLASSIVAIVMLSTELWLGVQISGGLLIPSALLLGGGIRNLTTVSRFRAYKRLLGKKNQCAIEKLARAVGKDVSFVRKDVRKMIGKGFFPEGHLDHEQNHLIISDATYRQFEQARLQLEAAQRQQKIEAANAPDPRIREVLDKGGEFLKQLRKCNDDIPGEEVSNKIYHMELILSKIFQRAKEHPEVIPDLKKLMDYYLPMTVKLLNAYADMDAQPVQGANIENAKREIEGTLDTLSRAFEKLLDELFQDTALDVSSDITVLQTLLAQEGLTDDELTKLKKENA
ncbi:MAG: 5-bromo-4-chloroindolyl phosphate hydrolysis family protein [Oscillospiraceae bacterium]|nr:5-bromo-4-chloroindolyl phosphate hydrolysis family protein [Oscillospiraceae bacterium]